MKWIALTALLLRLLPCFGQNLDQTFNMAQEQFESRNFRAALNTYERVIFFDSENRNTKDCYHQIAICHLFLNEPNQSFKAFDKAILFAENDSTENAFALEKVFYLLQNRYWKKALQELYSINPQNAEQERLHHYYLGAVLFATNDFTRSQFHLQKLTNTVEDSLRVANVFAVAKKKLNPARALWAKRVSYFIPGSGQIAAGNIKSGLNSILLLGGLGYLYVNTIENYGGLNAMITVLPWLSRYHVGGAENAEESMLNRQEKLKSQYFNQLVEIVRQG